MTIPIDIVQTARGFLYLPLYYARKKRFFGHVPRDYDITIIPSSGRTDESALLQMQDTDSDRNENILFCVCDPYELLKSGELEHTDSRLLCGLVQNAAFWAVDRGSRQVIHYTDLAKYPEIITYAPGTTGYALASRIRKDASPIDVNLIEVKPDAGLRKLVQRQTAVAITHDILQICELRRKSSNPKKKFQIEYEFGQCEMYKGLLVTGLMTRQDVIDDHPDLVKGLVLSLQESMFKVRLGKQEVREFVRDAFSHQASEEAAEDALDIAIEAGVFPIELEVFEPQVSQIIKVRDDAATSPSQLSVPGVREKRAYLQWVRPARLHARNAFETVLERSAAEQPSPVQSSEQSGEARMRSDNNGTRPNEKLSRQGQSVVPEWFGKAGLGFTVLTVASLFYLIVGPGVSDQRKLIFNVWVALCVAASAAFLGGSAATSGALRIPFIKDAPVRFSAFGGVAIFVVVFLLLAAANR